MLGSALFVRSMWITLRIIKCMLSFTTCRKRQRTRLPKSNITMVVLFRLEQRRLGHWRRLSEIIMERLSKQVAGPIFLFIPHMISKRWTDCLLTSTCKKSTLIMLVSAFAGKDMTMRAYRQAIQERYRFFSFGDAMLII